MGLYVGAKEALAVHAGAVDALAVYRGSELVWSSTPPPEWVPPASDLTNTCNGSEGEAVTVANSAGGGDPWQIVNNWTYEDTGMVCAPVSQISNFQWDASVEASPAVPDVSQSVGFWLRVDTLHPGNGRIHDMRNTSNTVTYGGIEMRADGRLRAVAGTTTVPESESPALVLGRRYWVTYGIDNVAAGSHRLLIQTPTGSTVHDWSGPLAGTGDQIGFRRFGKVTTSEAGLWFATVKATSGVSTGLPLEPEQEPSPPLELVDTDINTANGTTTTVTLDVQAGDLLVILSASALDAANPVITNDGAPLVWTKEAGYDQAVWSTTSVIHSAVADADRTIAVTTTYRRAAWNTATGMVWRNHAGIGESMSDSAGSGTNVKFPSSVGGAGSALVCMAGDRNAQPGDARLYFTDDFGPAREVSYLREPSVATTYHWHHMNAGNPKTGSIGISGPPTMALSGCSIEILNGGGPPKPNPLWYSDYEDGFAQFDDTPWNWVPDPPVLVAGKTGQGGRYPIPAGGNRCEHVPSNMDIPASGADWWHEFDVYLDNTPSLNEWQVIFQWKNDGEGSPPLSLILGRNGVGFRLEGGFSHPDGDRTDGIDIAPAENGRWYHMLIHVVLNSDPAVGSCDVWLDGEQKVSGWKPRGGTLYPGLGSYVKVGYYRSAAINQASAIVYDNVAIYDEDPR